MFFISCYDVNKIEIELGNINLRNLVNDLIENFSCGLGSEYNFEFNYYFKLDEYFLVDVRLFCYILENILSNVIKYLVLGSIIILDISKDEEYLFF